MQDDFNITARRRRNMADSEWKKFLKTIATVTDEDCWVTNYYKYARGQAKLYYKNEYMFLHQLSHLLFNSNVSNLASIFQKCNNFNCFNPNHLTDNLKEKQFKLEMPSKELLRGCPAEKDKKKILIDYGNWLSKELGRPLVQDDFDGRSRVSVDTIAKYFDGSISNYFNCCNFPSTRRKQNMTNSELKEFLKNITTITEKGCWITDYWKTSDPKGRISIRYKGKLHYLPRISYSLFKGNIPDGLETTHSCDNPPCYNPDHLFTNTHKGNMGEAAEKGRMGSIGKIRKHHKITDPYDYEALLNFIKQYIKITEKNEWIFPVPLSEDYPRITISNKTYRLHRLVLVNKLGKKYDEINGNACHVLPDGSKPHKHDVNPDHLFEGTDKENSLQTAKYSKVYKLNNDEVNQIKEAAAKFNFSEKGSKKRFDMQWATKLDVSRNCITGIRLGVSWNHDAY